MSAPRPSTSRTAARLAADAPRPSGAAPKGTGKTNALPVPPFDPVVYTPTIKARQPDGSIIVRPGVPVVLNGEDEISTQEAARLMGCSRDHVGRLCDLGTFVEGVDHRRIGCRGNYRIKRASVLKFAMLLRESPE